MKYCLNCGKYSYGKPYCYNCYKKINPNNDFYSAIKTIKSINEFYKIKPEPEEQIKIKKNNYICKTGITVKSKSEMIISNLLYDKRIRHEYEKHISIDEDPKHDIKPDFYIPRLRINGRIIYDVYIEHFGGANTGSKIDQERYNKTTKYKIPIYKEKGITLVCTYEEDIIDIENTLIYKLSNLQENTINYYKAEK